MPISRLTAATPEECGVDSAKLQVVFGRAELEVTEGRLDAPQRCPSSPER